jgi:carboxymethylenebutenolidase
MEMFGVTDYVRDLATGLAERGYTAYAPDFYAVGLELPHTDEGRARGRELLQTLTRERALAQVRAGIERLGGGRVGMLGCSVGGHIAYLAATRLDLAATVAFYPGWLTTTDVPLSRPEPTIETQPRGPVLVLTGEEDFLLGQAERDEIARHAELVVYPGAQHGFFCHARETYDAAASADAWARVERFFDAHLRAR